MVRKVFFSFHFERDAWRVSQVRNSQIITHSYHETQFLDAAQWEQIKKTGDKGVINWIDNQLYGTSCTIVLIGNQTSERRWVHYEIEKSWERGNGLFGIYIHDLKDQNGLEDQKGLNPFPFSKFLNNRGIYYPRVYDWNADNGRLNASNWIEQAISERRI